MCHRTLSNMTLFTLQEWLDACDEKNPNPNLVNAISDRYDDEQLHSNKAPTYSKLNSLEDSFSSCCRQVSALSNSSDSHCIDYKDDTNTSNTSETNVNYSIIVSNRVKERLHALRSLLQDAVENQQFDPDALTIVSINPGRDRVFMGHSDLPGLGGFTIDAATQNELFAIAQIDTRHLLQHEALNNTLLPSYKHKNEASNESNNSISSATSLKQSYNEIDTTNDGCLIVSNFNSTEFPSMTFSLNDMISVANEMNAIEQTIPLMTVRKHLCMKFPHLQDIWRQDCWGGYLHAAFVYLLTKRFFDTNERLSKENVSDYLEFDFKNKLTELLHDSTVSGCNTYRLRCHFGSLGDLKLPYTGGVSSSAALTGALTWCVSGLYHILWSRTTMIEVDYAEYLLGKTAGAADKAAQLFAERNHLVVSASLPHQVIQTIKLPDSICVFMCESPIPRLSSKASKTWLLETSQLEISAADAVQEWARYTQLVGGAIALRLAARFVQCVISNIHEFSDLGMNKSQVELISTIFQSSNEPLLRELGPYGEIMKQMNTLEPFCTMDTTLKHLNRYLLVYKLLKLIPSSVQVTPDTLHIEFPSCIPSESVRNMFTEATHDILGRLDSYGSITVYPKSAAMYGLSELERGSQYIRILRMIQDNMRFDPVDTSNKTQLHLNPRIDSSTLRYTILKLVRAAHYGDKAIHDYRKIHHVSNKLSDDVYIDSSNTWCIPMTSKTFRSQSCHNDWLETQISNTIHQIQQLEENLQLNVSKPFNDTFALLQPHSLAFQFGSLRRSLADIDEFADDLFETFEGKATMRIAAAGMGGAVAIHCFKENATQVSSWLEQKNFKVRLVTPAAASQQLILEDL